MVLVLVVSKMSSLFEHGHFSWSLGSSGEETSWPGTFKHDCPTGETKVGKPHVRGAAPRHHFGAGPFGGHNDHRETASNSKSGWYVYIYTVYIYMHVYIHNNNYLLIVHLKNISV